MPVTHDLIDLKEEFFRKFGNGPAAESFEKWQKWSKGHKAERARYVHCLALCAGECSDALVEKWLSQNPGKIDRERVAIFHTATLALGKKPPRKIDDDRSPGVAKKRGPTRVAVFTSLTVVSESYHFEVIRSIIRNAEKQNVLLSFHELSGEPNAAGARGEGVRLVVTRLAPDALLFIRITPDADLISCLEFDGRQLPTVLVHADRLKYPPPVIANVVPDHGEIERDLAAHLFTRRHIRGRGRPHVVMVAMQKEREAATYPPVDKKPKTIRNDRIQTFWSALKGCKRVRVTVPDYGFSQALKVWETHPNADAYVCLSDSLAVGLKHLLQARNRRGNACDRVVGFDGSKLARDEGVASFSQNLDWVGEQSLECLCRFLSQNRSNEAPVWPSDHEKQIVVPVRLKT